MPVYNMIYLGKFADIDADETNFNSEKALSIFSGCNFGKPGAPLYEKLISVSMNDVNNDGLLLTNNWSGTQETMSYMLPDGTACAREIDGVFSAREVEVTRLMPNGTTSTVKTMVRIVQDTSGNAFVLPPPITDTTQAEVAAMTQYPIVGIKLPTTSSCYKTDYNAAYAGRNDLAKFVPCFVAGTLIRTADTERPVETLRPGELVWTRDHGLQPIRWIGHRDLSAADLSRTPCLQPIRIDANALGPSQPSRPLTISRQHRILVSSTIARRMFGSDELLVAARHLTALPGIHEVSDAGNITFYHLMLDRHEVLMSEGALTESFYPGKQALAAIGPQAEEILALFPQLRDDPDSYAAARAFAEGRRARALADRHLRNGQQLA